MTTHIPDTRYGCAHAAQIKARRRRLKTPGGTARPADDARRSPSQRRGDEAEDRALAYLERAGLVLVARNLSCRAGEIDLIMRHADVLVFIEVRSRRASGYGGAAASIGPGKQRRIARAASYFLHTQWRGHAPTCRFDAVVFDDGELRWIRAAFALPG